MLNQEKWKEIESWELCSGMGKVEAKELCIMQAVDYISSGGISDHPKCACPILTKYSIYLNDRFSDEHRQLLKPFIPLLVGTKETDEVQVARKRLIRWRNVTVTYPLILDVIKLTEFAAKLRGVENKLESMAGAAKLLKASEDEVRAAGKKYANAYAYAYAYAYANANANANAYAYAYANANANAYAYAYAYANANAYARKAWSSKIAEVAIETLRIAIAITGGAK